MAVDVTASVLPPALTEALNAKGFDTLTAIQEAVLDPELKGRDLRISSQTGSGKTVAVGMVLAAELEDLGGSPGRGKAATPRVLIVAPTRELAAQLGRELEWLYASMPVRGAVVTGGTSVGGDFRALGKNPHILIGTPGRLTDHLSRGSIDLGAVRAVVLDEADEMLDMGFREDLERLLDATPSERRTHMVSATFSREVASLAKRYQRDAVQVMGTKPGRANDDIAHVAVVVAPHDRIGALINVLLIEPGDRTLVFVRTRAGTSSLANELVASGFSASALSGEMGQRERTATLEAFRAGAVQCLVATDVAARGLDIEDVGRVIHFELPESFEAFTHRSGRTGRAGNKGTSILFVPPSARRRAGELCRRAGIDIEWRPVPTPDDILRVADERLLAELGAESAQSAASDPRLRALAERLLESSEPADVVAALLSRSRHAGPCEPRRVRIPAPAAERAPRSARQGQGQGGGGSFEPFQVSFGERHGANPSRLLAMACRRGDVRGSSIGAIKIGEYRSVVEVATNVADDFARAVRRPDPRNPQVKFRREGAATAPRRPSRPRSGDAPQHRAMRARDVG